MSSRDIIKFPNCSFGLPSCCQHLTGISLMLGHPASEASSPRSTQQRPSPRSAQRRQQTRPLSCPLPSCPPPGAGCNPADQGPLGWGSDHFLSLKANTPTQQLEVSLAAQEPVGLQIALVTWGVSGEWGSAVGGDQL